MPMILRIWFHGFIKLVPLQFFSCLYSFPRFIFPTHHLIILVFWMKDCFHEIYKNGKKWQDGMISKRLHESFICPHLWFNWLIASWRAGCWLVDEIITRTCGSSANYKYHFGTLCFETLHSLLEMNWSLSVAWKFCWTKKQIQSIFTKSLPC